LALGRLRDDTGLAGAVLLATCNRVEIYADPAGADPAALPGILGAFLARDRGAVGGVGGSGYSHAGAAAVGHLFRVAAGLDSLVLGETEILGQLKDAYDLARGEGHASAPLNRAFQRAFAVAKSVRSATAIQRGNTGIAGVAVTLAGRVLGDLSGREVLVVGAGDTGGKVARALQGRGARCVIVANRAQGRAAALAAELGGRAVRFDSWDHEFARVDIVVCATDAPHPVLDRPKLERLLRPRGARPLLLIDLAVPRDVDPAVAGMPGVHLADIDDLSTVADEAVRRRHGELAACDAIVRAAAEEFVSARRAARGLAAVAA
jgi:glutamyl-tRNA reductase